VPLPFGTGCSTSVEPAGQGASPGHTLGSCRHADGRAGDDDERRRGHLHHKGLARRDARGDDHLVRVRVGMRVRTPNPNGRSPSPQP
jgi:hypothetical protein